MRVVIASSNPGKLRELNALLAPLGFEAAAQSEFTAATAEETGLSFVENAILKARHACRASGLPAIADDSGIEVDALHGAPGVYSARYAGADASDEVNLQKLLHELAAAAPDVGRTARYQCVLVYMRHDADPAPIIAQASWEGRILQAPRGAGGFGYDPIFQPLECEASAAELAAAEKNRLSHRGKALRALVEQLRREPAARKRL